MKIIIIIAFSALACTVNGQSLLLHARAEQTVKGSAFETGISYEGKKRFAIGAFFQTKGLIASQEEKTWNDQFYGILCKAPLLSARNITVGGALRAGLINEHFFVIVPSIETQFTVYRNTAVLVGSGYRHGYPSASIGLVQKLYTLKK